MTLTVTLLVASIEVMLYVTMWLVTVLMDANFIGTSLDFFVNKKYNYAHECVKIIMYAVFKHMTSTLFNPLFKVCILCYYGNDCNTPCGQCKEDDVCNNVTGECPRGCKPLWTGPRCDGKKILFYNNMTYMVSPQHKDPCPGGHKIYKFCRPFNSHHYYALSLSKLCPRVEKIFKSIIHFPCMIYMATP